jgi:hypothetical protein
MEDAEYGMAEDPEFQAWWRRAGVLRLLATGLPVFLIAAIVFAFWILSLVRSDEYKLLPVGSKAPDFSLTTVEGGEVQFDQHAGKHPLLLYFNEGMG